MREILFRGKICRDCKGVTTQKKYKEGDWVFGDLSHTNYNPPLIDQSNDDPVPVDPDTVGQCTGLYDTNGEPIFEGDIVEAEGVFGKIEYSESEAMFQAVFDGWCVDFDHFRGSDVEVIGNIHDNPELVEAQA